MRFIILLRDGAPIELTALLYCVLKQLTEWNAKKWYSFDRVITNTGQELTFKDWVMSIPKLYFNTDSVRLRKLKENLNVTTGFL